MKVLDLFFPLLLVIGLAACTEDMLPEPMDTGCDSENIPSYNAEVIDIIERTCAYSGCHLGGAPGVYDDYQGLLADLESGRFRERTITLRADPAVGMPPDYAPDGRPQDLTEDELGIITCWLEGGFPED